MKFDHAGMFGMNYSISDRETGSRWHQQTGEAFEGKLKGRRLEVYPFVLTSWKSWRTRHPKTLVLLPVPGLTELYAEMWRGVLARAASPGSRTPPADGQTIRPVDTRLPAYTLVVGVETGGARRAYELDMLKTEGVINDQVGAEPALVLYTPESDTVTMFARRVGGRTLTFERRVPSSDLVDAETGSRWNEYGECVAGSLRGSRLKMFIGEPQYWWAWAGFGGETSLYAGKGQPPR